MARFARSRIIAGTWNPPGGAASVPPSQPLHARGTPLVPWEGPWDRQQHSLPPLPSDAVATTPVDNDARRRRGDSRVHGNAATTTGQSYRTFLERLRHGGDATDDEKRARRPYREHLARLRSGDDGDGDAAHADAAKDDDGRRHLSAGPRPPRPPSPSVAAPGAACFRTIPVRFPSSSRAMSPSPSAASPGAACFREIPVLFLVL